MCICGTSGNAVRDATLLSISECPSTMWLRWMGIAELLLNQNYYNEHYCEPSLSKTSNGNRVGC